MIFARSAWLTVFLACLGTPSISAPQARSDIADKVTPCAACHGEQGSTRADGYYPTIAGKPADYLFNQLVNFRDGYRSHPAMNHMVAWLPDAYLAEMAAHFSERRGSQSAQAPSADAAALTRGQALVAHGDAQRTIPACTACHGQRLTGMLPATPGLIGLPRDYISAQLSAWRGGLRRAAAPDCMADIAQRLSGDEIADISAWLAAQPKPVDAEPAQPDDQLPIICGSHGEQP